MKDYLPIGTYVQCNGRVMAKKSSYKRTIWTSDKFTEGYIVGGSYLKEGDIMNNGYEEGISFKATKTVFVYKVLPGFTNKPIFVLPEQIVYKHIQDNPVRCRFRAVAWTDKDREMLSEYMKTEMGDWPRDAKGRWVRSR